MMAGLGVGMAAAMRGLLSGREEILAVGRGRKEPHATKLVRIRKRSGFVGQAKHLRVFHQRASPLPSRRGSKAINRIPLIPTGLALSAYSVVSPPTSLPPRKVPTLYYHHVPPASPSRTHRPHPQRLGPPLYLLALQISPLRHSRRNPHHPSHPPHRRAARMFRQTRL